ncbi:hypothetical protein B7H23_12040 [Notoacmeibacter marinus]|uniref:FAD:protein FMN transferase n=1 Tax=Notoacmeibacter marinus TaxID=1876515 RepID=A0A231UY34_9HYPH|nr:FAD:protein FMN transferase [Notoacmeibacter marinus]OXT00800.1 hypothetical protein B7H23_12040 [Notoacmeibacter marinus]
MSINRRRFIQIAAASSASLLMAGPAFAAAHVRWSGFAMGAGASLTIAGLPEQEAQPLIAAARAEIERMETLFSLYRPGSEIVRLNRDGRLAMPSQEMVALLSIVGTVHEATDGLFDPTVQPVWSLLAQTGGRPDRVALDAALGKVGWQDVRIGSDEIAFARDGMALTLNGIAQGYATDRVAALLKSAGLANVLVSVGEISALGEREPGQPWRVGLAEAGDSDAEETLALTDMAVATSAPKGTSFDESGAVGHILHPKRGPVAGQWRRISVIHSSAAIADGLSTGFALLPAKGLAVALAKTGGRAIAVDRLGARTVLSG